MAKTLETEFLVVGSGAGGATTAVVLAEAGRDVMVLEEGPRVEPGSLAPFSLEEMARQYRHWGASATLGAPPVAYAEGRCVGGSTEVNSGLWQRAAPELLDRWRRDYDIDGFGGQEMSSWWELVESWQSVSTVPGDPPASSAVLAQGAAALGWRWAEFPRVFRYDGPGRATKQSMSATLLPRAEAAGARVLPGCRVLALVRAGRRVAGARCARERPSGGAEALEVRADHVVVCGGAVQTPALLQRSGIRRGVGGGLRLHPTIKVAARFPYELDHDDVPMHRITQFAPEIAIGGSASRKGHIGLTLADSGAGAGPLEDWRHWFVYYAAIRADAIGRVQAVPGTVDPLVWYRLTDGDLSRLARGLVHLGEALLAAGASELRPSVLAGAVVRRPGELHQWWDQVDRARANLMTVHLTSSVRMGEDPRRAGADSYGRVWGLDNLRVNDASLLADAPGVNPQATIMAVAARNAHHLLSMTT